MAENKIRRGVSRDEMVTLIASGEAWGGTFSYSSGTYTVYLV